jgi:hypothetical protein
MPYTVVAIVYSLGIFGQWAARGNDQCVCNLGTGFLFNAVMMYIVLSKNEVFFVIQSPGWFNVLLKFIDVCFILACFYVKLF